MTAKQLFNIIKIAFVLILIGTSAYFAETVVKQQKEINRQTENFQQLNGDFQTLVLTNDELQSKVIQSDKRIRTADSILLQKDIKISQLQKLHVTTVIINNTDTVYLTNTDTLTVRMNESTTLIKTPFKDERNCIKIEGFIMSTDSFPSIAITSQNAEIETYEISVHRRWFQFWKPRTWTERYTKCGDLKVLDVRKSGK